MVPPQIHNRLLLIFELWVLRFVINLLKVSLTTTLAGTIMFALFMAQLFMTTGEGPISAGAALIQWGMKGFNFMLFSVTGGGDFEGGISELGALMMAFSAPYLTAISIVIAIAETLTGKSLFRWLRWPLKSRLIALLAIFALLIIVSVGGSNLPNTEVPYWLRIVALSFFGGWSALLLLISHRISVKAESAFRRYRDRRDPSSNR